jgi:hypothetical protein
VADVCESCIGHDRNNPYRPMKKFEYRLLNPQKGLISDIDY